MDLPEPQQQKQSLQVSILPMWHFLARSLPSVIT